MKELIIDEEVWAITETDGYNERKLAYFSNYASASAIKDKKYPAKGYYDVVKTKLKHKYVVYESVDDYESGELNRKAKQILDKLSVADVQILEEYFNIEKVDFDD